MSPGVYWRLLPNTLSYETTIPIVYTTKWINNNTEEDQQPLPVMDCQNDSENVPWCVGYRHINILEKLIDRQLLEKNKNWGLNLKSQENHVQNGHFTFWEKGWHGVVG